MFVRIPALIAIAAAVMTAASACTSPDENGDAVTGIIPRFLQTRERAMPGLTETIVTEDMHERKRLMFEQADAFVFSRRGLTRRSTRRPPGSRPQ